MPNLEDAIALALEAHRGKTDKAGRPYILHPLRVMLKQDDDVSRVVAVLHDVVEDSPYDLDDLRRMGYPAEVVTPLDCVTRRAEEDYEAFVVRAKANAVARKVKLADLEDNMDIRRLEAIDDWGAERLRKYLKAWRLLATTEA